MPATFPEVIDLWPSINEFAAEMGVHINTVRNWHTRGRIPAKYWTGIIECAKRREIRITPSLLTQIAASSNETA